MYVQLFWRFSIQPKLAIFIPEIANFERKKLSTYFFQILVPQSAIIYKKINFNTPIARKVHLAPDYYWSVPLAETDLDKTSFSLQRGKYDFNVTPYGLCNAEATYQRMMDLTMAGLSSKRVLAYLDDLVIFSTSLHSHLTQLREVLDLLRKANINLNLSKCAFVMSEVDFLGYALSEKGVQPQKRLTDAIRNFEQPADKKQLKRFLGLASYYRDFIPVFAEISAPLNRLSSEKSLFAWGDDAERSFEKLKNLLCSYPALAFPKIGETFIVEVDPSSSAVGGVLLQLGVDEK